MARIIGTTGVDRLRGSTSQDVINGGDGDDFIYGLEGNDYLYGDAGDDVLEGGIGVDRLYGGSGNDKLTGGQGADYLWGEGGVDTAIFLGNSANYSVRIGNNPDGVEAFVTDNVGTDGLDYLIGIERIQFADKTIFLVPNSLPTTASDTDAASNQVVEGAAAGAYAGITALAVDKDGDKVTYSLVNNANGAFTIDAATGRVTVLDPTKIDFETSQQLTVTVRASDGFDYTDQSFTVAVTNVAPSTPADDDSAADSVAEGAANGTAVGIDVSSVDVNGLNGGSIQYSLTDDAGGRFQIDATGKVTVKDGTKLDYETAKTHNITIQASDGTGSSSKTFAIAVTNVAPSTPADDDTAADSVAEGAANGTAVGIDVSSVDVNGLNGGFIQYSLIDDAGGRFQIDGNGKVTVKDGTKLDYETAKTHNITIQASDGTGSSSKTFAIAVTNVAPSTPADDDTAADSVAEGAANGTAVGIDVSSVDVNGLNGGSIQYSLTDDAGGRFQINGNGKVTVKDGTKLDYETAKTHNITIQASDGTGSSSKTFAIAVTNVAPSTPADDDTAADSVAEGAANGTAVGIDVSSVDVNGLNGGSIQYSLTDDAGGRFQIDATGKVTVKDGTKLDYETTKTHNITIKASDGTSSSSKTFAIAVTNVAPSALTDTDAEANQVAEGTANGTKVGVKVEALDPNGSAVIYSLTNDAEGRFQINASTGLVTVKDGTKLNYDLATSHEITVQASDGTNAVTKSFKIDVQNVGQGNIIADFEHTGVTIGQIPSGYLGFTWSYPRVDSNGVGSSSYWEGLGDRTGYDDVLTSGDYIAWFNGAADPSISRSTDFDFISGNFTAAWADGTKLTVYAYDDGVLRGSQTVVLNMNEKSFVQFDQNIFSSIDKIVFHTDPGTGQAYGDPSYIGVDDLWFVG